METVLSRPAPNSRRREQTSAHSAQPASQFRISPYFHRPYSADVVGRRSIFSIGRVVAEPGFILNDAKGPKSLGKS